MKLNKRIFILLLSFTTGFSGIMAQNGSGEFIKDIEGNIYKTVKIGSQTWMAENLKTSKLNNGTPIGFMTDDDVWIEGRNPGYFWYGAEQSYKMTYGTLYNFWAVKTKKLCPTGWHVPSLEEWEELSNYLGGEKEAGGKLKEKGTLLWEAPNKAASNSSGFTALPGGKAEEVVRFNI